MNTATSKVGRPTIYSQELADKICEELSIGKSLRTVCMGEDMPSVATIFTWMRTYPEFLEQYARAKEESTDALVEEMLDIADDSPNVIIGNDKSDGARVSAHKMRVDTRKWIASKLKPKKYGDKLDVMSDGKAIQGNTIIFKEFNATRSE